MKRVRVLFISIMFIVVAMGLSANDCVFNDLQLLRPVGIDIDDYRDIYPILQWKTDPVTGEIIAHAFVRVISEGQSAPGHNNGAVLQLEVLMGDTVLYQQALACTVGYDYSLVEDEMSYYVGSLPDYSALKIRAKTQVWGCYTDGALVNYYQAFERVFDLNITTPSVTYQTYGIHPKLIWNYQALAQYYEIYREVKFDGHSSGWVLWDTTPMTSYIDSDTDTDGKYVYAPSDDWIAYKVRAVNASGVRSSFSIIGYYKIADTGGKLPPPS